MMVEAFNVNVVVEHGYTHYKITDMETGVEVHCDMNELNKTIEELTMERLHTRRLL